MSRATVEVLALALGYSGAVALLGAAAVRMRRRSSVRGALFAVPLVTVLSVVAGVMGAARAMFISSHDLAVVLPVTAVASVVALVVAWVMARRVVRDVEAVRSAARALGGYDPADADADMDARGGPARTVAPGLRELADVDAEIRRAGERLAQARAREQAMERSRRDLVAWISHDLRTPLAGMRAMAEALEDGVATDPARYHRQMRREVDKLSHMVDDLFELSRIRSGGLSLTLEHVDLRDLVSDVLSGSAAVAEANGVALGAEADAASVRADAAGLGRVLSNLVVNAIRHTPADGTVHVDARKDGEDVVLSVSDACGGDPGRGPRQALRTRLARDVVAYAGPRRGRRARPGDRPRDRRGAPRSNQRAQRRRWLHVRRPPAARPGRACLRCRRSRQGMSTEPSSAWTTGATTVVTVIPTNATNSTSRPTSTAAAPSSLLSSSLLGTGLTTGHPLRLSPID